MAYIDTRPRPSPVSLGTALGVNALMIAGIIFAAPQIVANASDGPTIVEFIKQTPPKVEPATDKPKSDTATLAKRPTLPPSPPTQQKSENDVLGKSTLIAGPIVPPILPGGGEGVIIERPPLIIEPLFKAATLNPRYRADLQPEYPPGLIRQEVEGAVTLRVLVGTDGRVKATEVVRFDDEGFLKVTREQALRKWRFLPATRDGQPVESWREMTVRFQIPRG
jgi:periplasmic protein TonB